MRQLIPVLLLALVLSACGTLGPGSAPQQIQGTWQLETLLTPEGPQPARPDVPVVFTISADTVENISGRSILNTFTGTLRLHNDGAVRVPVTLFTTQRSGPQQYAELEALFLRHMDEAVRFEPTRTTLTLRSRENQVLLRFRRINP